MQAQSNVYVRLVLAAPEDRRPSVKHGMLQVWRISWARLFQHRGEVVLGGLWKCLGGDS